MKHRALLNTVLKRRFFFVYLILTKIKETIFKLVTKLYELNLFIKGKIISKPDEVVYVPVDLIEYSVADTPIRKKLPRYYKIRGLKLRAVGWIAKGDWETLTIRFDEMPPYYAFKERFVEGKEWEETVYYKNFHEWLKYNWSINKGTLKGCKNWREFQDKWLKTWDDIFNQTKKNGYHLNQNLNPRDNIEVVVSKQGKILFRDGRHRLSIAKILNVRNVPVIVNHWHYEFIDEVKKHTGKKKITPSVAIKYAIRRHKAPSK